MRRRFLLAGAALAALSPARARAAKPEAAAAIRAITGGAPLRPGLIKLDLPLLVENGNAVGMTVGVLDPLPGAAAVRALHVIAEGNPLPNVISVHFGPRAGRPVITTRIRLATSQTVHAIAACADGTFWTDSVELLVTLAACIDEL